MNLGVESDVTKSAPKYQKNILSTSPHITSSVFVSSVLHSFYVLIVWVCNFFGERKLTLNLLVKCWWNWRKVLLGVSHKWRHALSIFLILHHSLPRFCFQKLLNTVTNSITLVHTSSGVMLFMHEPLALRKKWTLTIQFTKSISLRRI